MDVYLIYQDIRWTCHDFTTGWFCPAGTVLPGQSLMSSRLFHMLPGRGPYQWPGRGKVVVMTATVTPLVVVRELQKRSGETFEDLRGLGAWQTLKRCWLYPHEAHACVARFEKYFSLVKKSLSVHWRLVARLDSLMSAEHDLHAMQH